MTHIFGRRRLTYIPLRNQCLIDSACVLIFRQERNRLPAVQPCSRQGLRCLGGLEFPRPWDQTRLHILSSIHTLPSDAVDLTRLRSQSLSSASLNNL